MSKPWRNFDAILEGILSYYWKQTITNFHAHLHKFWIIMLVRFYDDSDNQRCKKLSSQRAKAKMWVTRLNGDQDVITENLCKRIYVWFWSDNPIYVVNSLNMYRKYNKLYDVFSERYKAFKWVKFLKLYSLTENTNR